MKQLVLLKSHPYVTTFKVHILALTYPPIWRVKWRDFLTVKQDQDCHSEAEALALAQKLRNNCHILEVDEDLDDKQDLFDAIDYWKNVKRLASYTKGEPQ